MTQQLQKYRENEEKRALTLLKRRKPNPKGEAAVRFLFKKYLDQAEFERGANRDDLTTR